MNPLGILEWAWNGLPWYVHWGVIGFIGFTSLGGILSLYNFIRSFAGKWSIPAMASLVIPLGLWLFSLLQPKKRVTTEQQYDMPVPVRKPKKSKEPVTRKPRETVSDWFKRVTGQ
jgi:hypothetical protein